MSGTCDARLDLGFLLAAVEAAPPAAAVDVLASELRDRVGARDVTFLITDISGQAVVRLTRTRQGENCRPAGGDSAERVPLEGTPYDDVVRTQQLKVLSDGEATRVLAPVTDRGDAIGVLELTLPSAPDQRVIDYLASAAHALAYVVIANRRYTDLYEWGQRSTPFSLAAEIQRRLLPASFTCEAGHFTLSGWLEPAGEIGGDTFDYVVDRNTLHVSMSDAMGHAVDSALLATLLVGSLRNSRRRGATLAEQASLANEAVGAHAGGSQFVSGQLLRVDLSGSAAAIVNAGHPHPLLVRGDRVTELELAADLPFGMLPETTYRVQQLPLQPGDRLLLLTDGVLERNAARVDVAGLLADTRTLHPRETVHEVTQTVLEATGGELRDDATVLCLDWYGGDEHDKSATAGATQRRASPARP